MHTLLDRLSRLFSGKRIYFIYTHNNSRKRFRNGLTANTEISHWSLKALSEAFPKVSFLKLQGESEKKIAKITSKDVVIGHIGETFWRASFKTQRMIAFSPWAGHEDRSTNTLFNCIPLEKELGMWERAASVVLLTSEYNKREYIEGKRNFWFEIFQKLKRVRVVHQPIDLEVFKRIKWSYETDHFLYIGNDAHMKELPSSKKLVEAVGKNLALFGVDGKKLNHLDLNQVNQLPHLADFFIQPGMWEGQSVAILESAARGFIPLVSPETGYPYDHPFLLRYGDFEWNLNQLKKVLKTTPQERKELADELHRKLVQDVHHNDWDELTKVLVEEVDALFN